MNIYLNGKNIKGKNGEFEEKKCGKKRDGEFAKIQFSITTTYV